MSVKINSAEWFETMLKDFTSGVANVFLLHGRGVFDVNFEGMTVPEFLVANPRMAKNFNFVSFSPDQGIKFPGNAASSKFTKNRLRSVLMGEKPAAPAEKQSKAQQLLAQQAGNRGPSGGDEDLVLPSSPAGAIAALVDFIEQAEPDRDDNGFVVSNRTCIIVERMDLICAPGDKSLMPDQKAALLAMLHRSGTNRKISDREGMIILLAPSLEEVHDDLRSTASHIRDIALPLPAYDERLKYAEHCLKTHKVAMAPGVSINELASQTAGLARLSIEDIALCAIRDGNQITREIIKERKKILLRAEYADVIEVMETDITMDMLGGHELIKKYLLTYVIPILLNPAKRSRAPLSLAFLGASGTGKTVMAQAVANSIGWNCVLLRPEKTKGGIVGESERRLRRAFDGIEALAPCVVFLDEFDQGGRRSENTGGGGGDAVEANAFGAMLEFFGDQSHRGQILTIMASNRPDLIDPAFMRPGRTDDKFPFLPPDSDEERVDILVRLIKTHCQTSVDASLVSTLASQTENWTPAEIARLVIKAAAISDITDIPLTDALIEAKSRLVTSTRDIQKMTLLALEACDDKALVPEQYHSLMGRRMGNDQDNEQQEEGAFTPARTSRGARNLSDISSLYDAANNGSE